MKPENEAVSYVEQTAGQNQNYSDIRLRMETRAQFIVSDEKNTQGHLYVGTVPLTRERCAASGHPHRIPGNRKDFRRPATPILIQTKGVDSGNVNLNSCRLLNSRTFGTLREEVVGTEHRPRVTKDKSRSVKCISLSKGAAKPCSWVECSKSRLSEAAEHMGLKTFMWTRQRDVGRVELGLIWVRLKADKEQEVLIIINLACGLHYHAKGLASSTF